MPGRAGSVALHPDGIPVVASGHDRDVPGPNERAATTLAVVAILPGGDLQVGGYADRVDVIAPAASFLTISLEPVVASSWFCPSNLNQVPSEIEL